MVSFQATSFPATVQHDYNPPQDLVGYALRLAKGDVVTVTDSSRDDRWFGKVSQQHEQS